MTGVNKKANSCEDSAARRFNPCEDSAARRFNPCEDSVFVAGASQVFFNSGYLFLLRVNQPEKVSYDCFDFPVLMSI